MKRELINQEKIELNQKRKKKFELEMKQNWKGVPHSQFKKKDEEIMNDKLLQMTVIWKIKKLKLES